MCPPQRGETFAGFFPVQKIRAWGEFFTLRGTLPHTFFLQDVPLRIRHRNGKNSPLFFRFSILIPSRVLQYRFPTEILFQFSNHSWINTGEKRWCEHCSPFSPVRRAEVNDCVRRHGHDPRPGSFSSSRAPPPSEGRGVHFSGDLGVSQQSFSNSTVPAFRHWPPFYGGIAQQVYGGGVGQHLLNGPAGTGPPVVCAERASPRPVLPVRTPRDQQRECEWHVGAAFRCASKHFDAMSMSIITPPYIFFPSLRTSFCWQKYYIFLTKEGYLLKNMDLLEKWWKNSNQNFKCSRSKSFCRLKNLCWVSKIFLPSVFQYALRAQAGDGKHLIITFVRDFFVSMLSLQKVFVPCFRPEKRQTNVFCNKTKLKNSFLCKVCLEFRKFWW